MDFYCSHNSQPEILAYQTSGVGGMDYPADIAHQLILRHIVEELLQVYVHYSFSSLIEVFQKFQHGLPAAPAGTKAIAVFLKFFLKDGR